jgi:nucleoside-triphosphatase
MVEHTAPPAYLLTGEPRTGKSTLIKRLVEQIGIARCGGFYTEEVQENGARRGFRLVTLDGRTGIFAHKSLRSPIHHGRYGIDLPCLETLGLPALSDALKKGALVIIDELGPMEAYSESFRVKVLDVLNSTAPFLGTIAAKPHPWLDTLKRHKRVMLYQLTRNNREEVFRSILNATRVALLHDKGRTDVIGHEDSSE